MKTISSAVLFGVLILLGVSQAGCSVISAEVKQALYEPKAIPTSMEAYTQKQFDEAFDKFQQRTMEEAYQTAGKRNPSWDEAALKFIKDCRLYLAYDHFSAENQDKLVNAGEKLLAMGCDDPLVVYLYGALLQDRGDLEKAQQNLEKAVAGFRESKYPRARAAFSAKRLAEVCAELEGEEAESVAAHWKLAKEWTVESFRDSSYLAGESRIALKIVDDLWGYAPLEYTENTYKALCDEPGADPYVVAVMGGVLYIDKAWEERGSDWAYTVSESGWRGFKKNLKVARELLTEAWQQYPEYPEAPAEMIVVTKGESEEAQEPARQWFDRAVAAQMDYPIAYDYYLNYLLPRWHGSHEEMYDFAVECLETKRFDTEVPHRFLRVLCDITLEKSNDSEYWDLPETAPRLETLFKGYESVGTNEEQTRWKSRHVAAAWKMRDWKTARALLDELGSQYDNSFFNVYFYENGDYATSQIYAFSGPESASLLAAEKLANQGNKEAAQVAYAGALASKDLDPRALNFIKHRFALLKLESQFEKNEWVSLNPEPSLAGWFTVYGKWSVEPDGSLRGEPADERLWISCDADFGNKLELRGEIEFISVYDDPMANAAIGLGYVGGSMRDDVEVFFYPKANRIMATYTFRDDGVMRDVKLGASNSFHIQLWDDSMNVTINGKTILRGESFDRVLEAKTGKIGFGAKAYSSPVTLRFRKLEVRRLTSEPI